MMRSMFHGRGVRLSSAALLVLLVSGCQKKEAGELRQDCYPNGTCNEGLTCAGGICVPVEGATTTEAVPQGSPEAQAETAQVAEIAQAAARAAAATQAEVHELREQLVAQQDVEAAFAAYRAHYNAWNRHDALSYFSNYLPTLDCYYNEANYAATRLQSGSRGRHFSDRGATILQIGDLELIGHADGEVAFLDRGTYLEDGRTRDHEKLIVMRRAGSTWKIATEVSRSAHACHTADFPSASAQRGDARQPLRCDDYLACFRHCARLEDEDLMMDCDERCSERSAHEQPCTPTYDPVTHPCDALRECAELCHPHFYPGGNYAEICGEECAERYGARCPSYRGED